MFKVLFRIRSLFNYKAHIARKMHILGRMQNETIRTVHKKIAKAKQNNRKTKRKHTLTTTQNKREKKMEKTNNHTTNTVFAFSRLIFEAWNLIVATPRERESEHYVNLWSNEWALLHLYMSMKMLYGANMLIKIVDGFHCSLVLASNYVIKECILVSFRSHRRKKRVTSGGDGDEGLKHVWQRQMSIREKIRNIR